MLKTKKSRVVAGRIITALVLIPVALFSPVLTFKEQIFDMWDKRESGIIAYLQLATCLGWFATSVITIDYLVWLLMDLVPNWARYGTRDPELMREIEQLRMYLEDRSEDLRYANEKRLILEAQLCVEKLKRRKLKKRLREFNDPQSDGGGYIQPPTLTDPCLKVNVPRWDQRGAFAFKGLLPYFFLVTVLSLTNSSTVFSVIKRFATSRCTSGSSKRLAISGLFA